MIVSEFIDIFVKFLTLCPRGGAFDSLFCPEGRGFVHNDCPRGRVLPPSCRVPGVCFEGGMVLDEIDTCITMQSFSPGRMPAGVSPTGGRYFED